MNDDGMMSRMLSEQQNGLWLPMVFEIVQMLLWVLVLIALLSLIVVLIDLFLLCREMYKKPLPHPTTKSPATTNRDAALVQLKVADHTQIKEPYANR